MKATENVLSKLKLRLGYGVTGQQEIEIINISHPIHSALILIQPI